MTDQQAGPEGITGEVSWREKFLADSELLENPSLATIPDVPALAKAFVDTKGLVGKKGVILPGEEAKPEDWERFYGDLGRPENPEGYVLEKPASLPENFPYSPELETAYRQMAHKAGLTPRQTKALYDDWLKINVDQLQHLETQSTAKKAELEAGLQKDWGAKYEANLTLARQAQRKFAPEGSPELLALDGAMGNDPRLVKLFYNIGQAMGEAALVTGDTAVSAGDDARRQELMRHPGYLDIKHPEHKMIVEQVRELYQKLYPEAKKE